MLVIYFSNWLPKSHPTNGINAWNPPKNNPITSACFLLTFRIPSPLQIDTANASMDSPTPIRNNSIKNRHLFQPLLLYQTFSVIFPQLFCTVCAISAVISNFPHVFTDNIYLLNMSKKETPRIFLYRISPQISLQKYTWVSFFKICQVLLVCARQKETGMLTNHAITRTTPSRFHRLSALKISLCLS